MNGALQDLYIYYQVAEHDCAALAVRVRAMQARVGQGQLRRRPGSTDGRQTWMEIYVGVHADFALALAAAVQAAALAELTAGARHTEVFTELAPMEALPCA